MTLRYVGSSSYIFFNILINKTVNVVAAAAAAAAAIAYMRDSEGLRFCTAFIVTAAAAAAL